MLPTTNPQTSPRFNSHFQQRLQTEPPPFHPTPYILLETFIRESHRNRLVLSIPAETNDQKKISGAQPAAAAPATAQRNRSGVQGVFRSLYIVQSFPSLYHPNRPNHQGRRIEVQFPSLVAAPWRRHDETAVATHT